MGTGDLPPQGQLQAKGNDLPQLPLALAAPATPKPTTKLISSSNGDEIQPHTPSFTGPVPCTTRLQPTRLTQPSSTRGLDEPISARGELPPSSTVDGHYLGACMESVTSPAKQVPQKSLTNITKFADPGAAGKVKVTTFAPMTDCQTGGDKKYITSNEKPAIGLNPFHDCNDASPLPCRNANPIPTGTLINFERRKFQSAPPTEAMYSPIAPATPNQSKRVQYCMPSTVGELVARSTHGNGMSKPPANEHVVESERASYIPSREAESSSQRSSAQEMVTRKMVEEEEQGTDSSKTPRQKPKRRKHRPKVVREDKSNKTPKPGTPKPVTPEPIRPKQENRVKRKYVRKKLGPEHPGTPSTTLHEHMDQCDSTRTKGTPCNKPGIDAAKHGRRKYVRKIRQNHLESTSDMVTETDGGHKAENPHQNIETEISERKRTRRKYMPQKKSLHDSETPPNAVRGTANLRDSSDPKEIVREQVGYKTRLVRRRLNFDSEGQTVNGKSVALLTNSRTASPAKEECSDTITLSASRSTVQLDHGFEVGVENPPGGVAYNLNLTLSKMSEEYTKLPEQAIPTQLYRGERLEENSRELVEHSDVSSCATNSGGVPQIELQQTKMQDGANGTSDVLLEENIINKVAKRGALHEVQCHETSRHTPILPNIYKKRRTEKAYRQRNINSSWTYFGSHMFTVATLDKLMTLQKSQDNEHILRFDQMEVATRKRSKVSIRARNSCSLTKLAEKFSAGTWPKKKSRSVSETLQDERLHRIEISYIYDNRSSRNIQKAVHSNFMTRDIVPYVDPVDDIIQKLKYLSIAGGSQVQNALTIYARETMMLPMSGPFDLTLKRQPRPKVDLDPETHRVWKLLMGKAGNNKAETINIDKDKRWQEERQVFRGRVDSFIARMHLVQGDRRFCPWKGSVVDSVVGVFLTQNVSDHLSSSAFMALAARFPPQPRNNVWELDAQKLSNALYQQDGCKQQFNCSTSCGRMSILEVSSQLPMRIREADDMEEEMANWKASLRSHTGDPSGGCSTVNSLQLYEKYVEVHHQILDNRTSSPNFIAGSNSLAGIENKASEDLIASQVYADPSKRYSGNLIQMDQIAPSSDSNSETELTVQSKCSCLENFSFMELLQIEDRALIHSYCTHNSEYLPSAEYCHQLDEMPQESTKSTPSLDQVNDYKERCPSKYSPDIDSNYQCKDMPYLPSIACCFQKSSESGSSGVQVADKLEDKIKYYFPPTDSGSNSPKHIETTNLSSEYAKEATTAQWQPAVSGISVAVASYPCKCKPHIDLVTCSVAEECFEEQCSSHLPREESKAISCIEARDKLLQLHEEHPAKYQQNKVGTDLRAKERHHAVKASSKTHEHCEEHQTFSNSCNNLDENSVVDKEVELNQKDKDQYLPNAPLGKTKIASSTKKVKADRKANKPYDWDSLRKQASSSSTETQRNNDRRDSLDWEALRNADVGEISQTIRERGMNNVLAERIKDFLNRLVLDHGSIDLEWLRNIEPDKAKDYLLSIRGLGLKSVECVRLLTLQHLAFPVDTNVGRICVRLGWVPLQPLPESLQLHLLELYPVLETIQKYLWPRLCMLDQRTLYELHYQMITFGKVFCTKSKPNCNACPMRGECKHFASAFASLNLQFQYNNTLSRLPDLVKNAILKCLPYSARLALPAPEEKSLVSTTPSTSSENKHYPLESRLLPHPLDCQLSWERPASNNSEPIIEEPMTPEPENKETLETEIEDAFYEDPDQIPTIKLNLKEFAQNVQDAIRANNNELQDGDLSKSLVTISPEAASIPMPKLKNVSRLRTEHQVYELPDSHPLLEEMDRREPDDPSPYLLAIWTPGETAESTEPPEICCNSQDTGALCEKEICFACNSIREARARTVRGTLLIPCRTAMRGSFPLNGTYFQVNEVFADHDSSFSPLNVPRGWIWNLPRRTVYFGTSVPTIFRGLTTEEIQKCFWRGFVCVRGFDRKSRAPKPLYPRLHFPASKARGNRKQATNEE